MVALPAASRIVGTRCPGSSGAGLPTGQAAAPLASPHRISALPACRPVRWSAIRPKEGRAGLDRWRPSPRFGAMGRSEAAAGLPTVPRHSRSQRPGRKESRRWRSNCRIRQQSGGKCLRRVATSALLREATRSGLLFTAKNPQWPSRLNGPAGTADFPRCRRNPAHRATARHDRPDPASQHRAHQDDGAFVQTWNSSGSRHAKAHDFTPPAWRPGRSGHDTAILGVVGAEGGNNMWQPASSPQDEHEESAGHRHGAGLWPDGGRCAGLHFGRHHKHVMRRGILFHGAGARRGGDIVQYGVFVRRIFHARPSGCRFRHWS